MPRGADDRASRLVTGDRGGRDAAMAMHEGQLAKLMSLVDVLEPLSEGELGDLARRCSEVPAGDGEDFYRPEAHEGGLFIVLEGRVRVYLTTQAGKETTLNLLGSGTVLWARRLEPTGGHAVHARAVGPTALASLGRGDLERLVLNKPEVGLRMMDLLAERLAESNERMAEVAHKEVLPRPAGQGRGGRGRRRVWRGGGPGAGGPGGGGRGGGGGGEGGGGGGGGGAHRPPPPDT